MRPAPILFFVFNRPEHTGRTIESLKNNNLAPQSELFVFSDGPRSEKDVDGINKVRGLADSLDGFKKISVTKRQCNLGLARSVISGVTDIINRYGRVIVVEDDLELSPYFLDYMNEALQRYEKCRLVYSVGGYSPPINMPAGYKDDSYISYRCCTWGWGTWKDRWDKVDWDVKDFDSFINDPEAVRLFNRGGEDMAQILKMQMDGKLDSWGIRWDYAHYKNSAFCFRPVVSLVNSFGNDGSGVHCSATDRYNVNINRKGGLSFPAPEKLTVSEAINDRFATFYDGKPRAGCDEDENVRKPELIDKVVEAAKKWISSAKNRS